MVDGFEYFFIRYECKNMAIMCLNLLTYFVDYSIKLFIIDSA